MKKYLFFILIALYFLIGFTMTSAKNSICSIIDDVQITDEMISDYYNSLTPKDKEYFSWTVPFFISKDNNQIIYIEICCAHFHKLHIYIFDKINIPQELLDLYNMNYKKGYLKEDAVTYIKNRIENAIRVDSKYFITKKGAKLGMSSKDIVSIYGTPHYIEIVKFKPKKILRFKWKVFGFTEADHFGNIPKENVCKQLECNHEISVDFVDDKAVVIHIENEVP